MNIPKYAECVVKEKQLPTSAQDVVLRIFLVIIH